MIYTIVVTYNGVRWVDKCFGSLINSKVAEHRILAVNNGSSDNTSDILRCKYPEVEIIETGQNLGFGKANNIGIRKAIENNADYVFLLNQDAWVEQDTISKLMETAEKYKQYSILSPMQYFNKETLDYKFKNYYKGGILQENGIIDVLFVNAAVWLIRTSDIIELGLFNECFSHYGEDSEFCIRYMLNNKKIGIVKNAISFHERPQQDKSPSEDEMLKRTQINIFIRFSIIEIRFFRGILSLFRYLISNKREYYDKDFFLVKYRFKIFLNCIPVYYKNRKRHIINITK